LSRIVIIRHGHHTPSSPLLRRRRRSRRQLQRIHYIRRRSGAPRHILGAAQRADDADVSAHWRSGAADNADAAETQPIKNVGFNRRKPSTTDAEKIPNVSKHFLGASSEAVDLGDRRHSAAPAEFLPRRAVRRDVEDVQQRLRAIPRVGRQRRRHPGRARRQVGEKRSRQQRQTEEAE